MHPDIIRPNYHVILVHYPLALLSVGIFIELFSFLWRRHSIRTVGRWMILLGALSCVPAMTSGIYAMWDVASHRQDGAWTETKSTGNLNDVQWDLLKRHVILNAIGVGIILVSVVTWMGASDRWRRRLYLPVLVLLVAGMAWITMAAWFSGEMVYAHQVSVEPGAQPESVMVSSDTVHPAYSDADQEYPPDSPRQKIDRYVNAMQLHLIAAGVVVAVALAALALSIRGITAGTMLDLSVDHAGSGGVDTLPLHETDEKMVAALMSQRSSDGVITKLPPKVPSTRFWMLAALIGLLTAAGGLYVGHILTWEKFQQDIIHGDSRRMIIHTIFAGSIFVLAIVLAILSRWTPHSSLLLSIFALVLILVVAAQVWIGILLLFDTDQGPLNGFTGQAPTIPSAHHVMSEMKKAAESATQPGPATQP